MPLAITRKVGESVVIQDMDITITVAKVHAGRVKLLFDAPRHVIIDREEIKDRHDEGHNRNAD